MSTLYHPVQLPLFVFKVCPACIPPTEKYIDEFARDRTRRDGHAGYCKVCSYAKIYAIQAKGTPSYEKKLVHDRKYAKRHRESKEYQATQRVQSLTYARRHPKQKAEAVMRRRALLRALTVEKVDYDRILEHSGYWCHICEKPIDPSVKSGSGKLVFDHVIPLRPRPGEPQGTHSENNIKPAHSVCNYRKHNKRLEDLTPYQRHGVD